MTRYRGAHTASRGALSEPRGTTTSPGGSGQPVRPGQTRRRLLVAVVLVTVLAAAAVATIRLRPPAKTATSKSPSTHAAPGEQDEETGSSSAQVVSGEIGPAGPTADWVKAENAKPGTSDWRLSNVAKNGEVEGYTNLTSVDAGQPVTLLVSTTASTYRVEAYRMGYYGGLGARLVWRSGDLEGHKQANPTIKFGVNLVEARWDPSLTVQTVGWPEGDYLFKLVASTGGQQWVPLTVRNDRSTAAFVVMNAVTTWQAYNLWGGYDLYEGASPRGSDSARRASIVSFDRPYKIGLGSGDFLGNEYPLVSMLESFGSDVTYVTSIDIDQHPELLEKHKAALSLGHDEYYSTAMRNGLQAGRDSGVNLAILGANAVFRHIRFASSSLGPDRQEINYRSASKDPMTGRDNADVTVSWRDPPNNNPESKLIGDFYQCNPVKADMVVADSSNWLFAGAGVHNGQRLAGIVGSEYDHFEPGAISPNNVEVLFHSPLRCGGKADHSDATYYTAPSGAGVFASGTSLWVNTLQVDPKCSAATCPGPVLIRVTQNLLAAFGAGPAGQAHPSAPNAVAIGEGERPLPGATPSTTESSITKPISAVPVYRQPVAGSVYRPPAAPATTTRTSTTATSGATAPTAPTATTKTTGATTVATNPVVTTTKAGHG